MTNPVSKQKKVLIISFSDFKNDPRVYRQVIFFSRKGYDLSTIGFGSPEVEGVQFYSCSLLPNEHRGLRGKVERGIYTLLKKYNKIYFNLPIVKKCLRLLEGKHFDLIVANEIDALPLALRVANDASVLYDAHEYSPREIENQLAWRIFFQGYKEYLCKEYLPKVKTRITVCDGIAKEYQTNFNTPFHVITNAPFTENLNPAPMNENEIRLIYHGCASPQRSIEDVIKIMNYLDERFRLDMILIPGCRKYIKKIEQLANNNSRIRFLQPRPMKEISAFCNQYDIGFYPLKPLSLNNYYSLPNKFFEFIQARVAIAIFPLPEMERLIKKYSIGVVANDFEVKTLAQTLNQLTSHQIWKMKLNTHKAAETLCAEKNFSQFETIINGL